VFQHEDISSIESGQIQSCLNQKVRQVFILEEGPLYRLHLFSLSHRETIVLITIHHIVFDGKSALILMTALFDAYRVYIAGKEPRHISLPATYKEFVEKEQEMLRGKEGELRQLYWKKQLVTPLPRLNLPTDQPRSNVQNRFEGKSHSHILSYDLSTLIKLFSKEQQTYLSTVFLGLFKVLLYRYTSQRDIIIGMPVNERNKERFNHLIGFLINMVPIRTKIPDDEILSVFLNKLQKTMVNAMANSYPFSALVRELKFPVVGDSHPVVQVAFMYQDLYEGMDSLELPVEFVEDIRQEGEYEIVLEVMERKNGFILNWKYNPELFDE
ncbi:MAG: hypothetical protein GY941_29280, partial [Planctomycetes bacterium]|nr:hypothetical protein [Planctomycetota bacterium]